MSQSAEDDFAYGHYDPSCNCVVDEHGVPTSVSGQGGNDARCNGGAGDGDSGDAGASSYVVAPDNVWNQHSRALDLHCFANDWGPMRFHADRSELTQEQLGLLNHLKGDLRRNSCAADELSCDISITDDASHVETYISTFDGNCSSSAPAISWETFGPLQESLGCKFSHAPSTPLAAHLGCENGMYSEPGVIHQPLVLDVPGKVYHLALESCDRAPNAWTLQLFGMDPLTPIATGAVPDPSDACPALDITVTESITADMVLTIPDPGAPSGSDFYFRFF
jgi:hypothetical protein